MEGERGGVMEMVGTVCDTWKKAWLGGVGGRG